MKQNWKRQFGIIYAGQAFSILGSAAVQFSIIWWLTAQTESAITLTTAAIVSFLPNIFIGPFAGVWVDRYNRRTVMIAADSVVAASSALLGAFFLVTQTPPVWFIYIISCTCFTSGHTYACTGRNAYQGGWLGQPC